MNHLAIFYGEIHNKIYRFDKMGIYLYFNGNFEPELYETSKYISKKEFLRIEIDNPPIEINEEVYIEQIDKTVKIKHRVRNATGGYIYYTDNVIDIIINEESEVSKINAESLQMEYIAKKTEIKEEITLVKDEVKKWYQFWK
jgi:hypothetical protein